jgi:hypothetical protein
MDFSETKNRVMLNPLHSGQLYYDNISNESLLSPFKSKKPSRMPSALNFYFYITLIQTAHFTKSYLTPYVHKKAHENFMRLSSIEARADCDV